jgi:hypothetical protein
MNGNGLGYRSVYGPVMIITVGLLFALNNFTDWGFERTWPVLIIVAGLLSLLRRTMGPPMPGPPPSQAPPYVQPQQPYGSYRQTPYMQTNYPPAPPANEPPKNPGVPQ